VTQTTRLELVLNLRIAKTLGITMTRELLLSANAVIQQALGPFRIRV